MLNKILASLLVVVPAFILLVGSAKETGAGDSQSNFAVYGFIYPATQQQWDANKPSSNKDDAARYNFDMIENTHYRYDPSPNPTTQKLAMQKAVHRAIDDGWQVVGFQGDSVVIYHPKRTVYSKGRK